MNIFLAGIHGVGKTYLSAQLPANLGLIHASASTLILEERALPNWGTDKLVADIDENQAVLIQAVKRHNDAGTRLILDGHFVLLNAQGKFSPLEVKLFSSLDLDGVVLLEAEPGVIVTRINERDRVPRDEGEIAAFMAEERRQARAVCGALNIQMVILMSPGPNQFADVVGRMVG